jgi:hypothetical protein
MAHVKSTEQPVSDAVAMTVLVVKVKALRRGLYPRDRVMLVLIVMVTMLGSKVSACRAFTLDP